MNEDVSHHSSACGNSNLPHHALRFVGVASLVFAGLGLWYNTGTLFTRFPPDPSEPYFLHAFYSMSAVCVVCYLTLLFVAVQFIRLDTSWLRLFTGVMVFEAVYFFSVALLWADSTVGRSVAAATGIANGGLMFQFVTLFLIWGPLLAGWAKRRIEAGPEGSNEVLFPEERIARPSDWAWAAVHFLVMFVLASVLLGLIWRRLNPGTVSPGYVTSIALLLSAANALASVPLRRKRRRRGIKRRREGRLARGLCPRCEYNLTGLTGPRCPECGERI